MRISDLIAQLTTIKESSGDLEVYQGANNTTLGGVSKGMPPRVKELAILNKRESNPRIVYSVDKAEAKSGIMILYIGR